MKPCIFDNGVKKQVNDSRNSSIELFRLILMSFIIGFHIISYGAFHPKEPLHIADSNFFVATFFESVFVIAVNCFVLISGYFLINASREKFVKIYTQVLTYSVGLSFVFAVYHCLAGIPVDYKELSCSIFPIVSKRWWFFTAYIVLFLASPMLNLVIGQFNKRRLQAIIGGMFAFFVISPSIGFTVLEGRGFNFVHFIFLYFIGAYIRRYITFTKVKIYFVGYLFSTTGIIIYTCFLDTIGRNAGYITASFAYNNILVVAASIFLFGIFTNLKMGNHKTINSISVLVFGVYLFHEHPQIKAILYTDIFHCNKYSQTNLFVPNMLLTIFIVLAVGLVLEYLRVKIVAQPINNFFLKVLNKVLPKNKF